MNPMGMYQNPMLGYYQNMMAQQMGQYPSNFSQPQGFAPPPVSPAPQVQYYVKQVGGVEEARSCTVEPGCKYLFIDKSSDSVYCKSMGNDGLSRFDTYVRKDDGNTEKIDPFAEVNRRLSGIENILGGILNGKYHADDAAVHAESITGNAAGNFEPNARTESAEIPKRDGNDERQGRSRPQTAGGKYREGQGH